jgi:hypothetical protein
MICSNSGRPQGRPLFIRQTSAPEPLERGPIVERISPCAKFGDALGGDLQQAHIGASVYQRKPTRMPQLMRMRLETKTRCSAGPPDQLGDAACCERRAALADKDGICCRRFPPETPRGAQFRHPRPAAAWASAPRPDQPGAERDDVAGGETHPDHGGGLYGAHRV